MSWLKKHKGAIFWVAAIAYMAFIFYLSSRPAPELARRIPIIYKLKIVHMAEYGLLSILFFFALKETSAARSLEAAYFAVVAVFLYGAIDELHQVFVPMRSASLVDIVANCIGATVAQWGLLSYTKQRERVTDQTAPHQAPG